jgi:hypothetical protein
MDLEPHPVSGELELEDTRPAKYRRLDEETLHSRIEVKQFDLLPVYVWCEKDEHGGTEPGWKLADLRALDDNGDAKRGGSKSRGLGGGGVCILKSNKSGGNAAACSSSYAVGRGVVIRKVGLQLCHGCEREQIKKDAAEEAEKTMKEYDRGMYLSSKRS